MRVCKARGKRDKEKRIKPSVHVNYLYCYLLWKSLRTAFPDWSHTLEKGTEETSMHRSCSRAGSPEQANSGLIAKLKNRFTKLQTMVHIKLIELLRSKTIRESQANKSQRSFFIKLNAN